MQKTLQLILGDQLYPRRFYADENPVFFCEDRELCTHYRYHKHKIVFFLASMRQYAAELEEKGYEVHYFELSKKGFFENLYSVVKQESIQRLLVFEVEDKFFEKKIQAFCRKQKLELETRESPKFLTTRTEFKEYLQGSSKPFMKTFYEGQRRRREILMDGDKPRGGKFSFDEENRKKLPAKECPPELPEESHSVDVEDVKKLVDAEFPDHPGTTDTFWLPTTRTRALFWLRKFFQERFEKFGPYEDAITDKSDAVYHSALSPLLNNGLLTPDEVVDKALAHADEHDIPLSSLEGFIRQIIGWREFIRGVYQNFSERQDSENFFGHTRQLTDAWYDGTTGIPPLDDAIKKAQRMGWNHHIERLMILSNMMLLCEIEPREAHRWFMEMYVDSADWVMGPNVYGMGQFSDGGIFATKPYICGSNYIRKMSAYPKGEWCDVMDGLYWRFVDRNREFYATNARAGMILGTLDRMNSERRKRIFAEAEDFIQRVTS